MLDFVVTTKRSLSASEVSRGMGAEYLSLRHRTHASSVLNLLVSKRSRKIKVAHSYYFTMPVEVVMGCLKGCGEEPDRCSPYRIAMKPDVTCCGA